MTFESLSKIIEEKKIPKNVHFLSDSGWECGPTEMDYLYYNSHENTLIFSQDAGLRDEYEESETWELVYAQGTSWK